jgi:release factor glutamine methyltransferase
MLTVGEAVLQGACLLEDAGIAVSRLTAEVLLSHAMHCERVYLYAHSDQPLKEVEWIHYGRYLHERIKGKPTQYITGRQEFYGREFHVTPDVLIPRPETEHVVAAALRVVKRGQRVLDVGTGSGALPVTLQLEAGVEGWGTDISPAAIMVARDNARRLGAPIRLLVCDLMCAIAPGSVDVIVSNPPYVPSTQKDGLQREVRDWEPHVALFAGESGFEIYDRIVADAPRVLRPGGCLIMELGFGCVDHVAALLSGWQDVRVDPDLAGIPRVISAKWPGVAAMMVRN